MGGYAVVVLDVGVSRWQLAGGVGFLFFTAARIGAWQPRVRRKQTSRLTKREVRARA